MEHEGGKRVSLPQVADPNHFEAICYDESLSFVKRNSNRQSKSVIITTRTSMLRESTKLLPVELKGSVSARAPITLSTPASSMRTGLVVIASIRFKFFLHHMET